MSQKKPLRIVWSVDEQTPVIALVTSVETMVGSTISVNLQTVEITDKFEHEGHWYARFAFPQAGLWRLVTATGLQWFIAMKSNSTAVDAVEVQHDQACEWLKLVDSGMGMTTAFFETLLMKKYAF